MKGNGTIQGNALETDITIPESLGGSDPKELMASSASACYALTLVHKLHSKKLPVESLTMDSKTENTKNFTLTHHPHVTLSAEATEEQKQQTEQALQDADTECPVGNMLKKADAEITINGDVSVQ